MASKFITSTCISGGAAILAFSSAMAGGYVEPIINDAPVAAAPVTSAVAPLSWTGAYVGGAVGYQFAGDDVVGLEAQPDPTGLENVNNLGEVDTKGAIAELSLGYRWEVGDWVVGPSLSFAGGRTKATDSINGLGVAGEIRSETNYLVSLRWKAGYLLNQDSIIYGSVGGSRGDFDYNLTKTSGEVQNRSYTDTALSLGLGFERRISSRVSVFGEWELYRFNKNDVIFEDAGRNLVTEATPEQQRIKVGVNFQL